MFICITFLQFNYYFKDLTIIPSDKFDFYQFKLYVKVQCKFVLLIIFDKKNIYLC